MEDCARKLKGNFEFGVEWKRDKAKQNPLEHMRT